MNKYILSSFLILSALTLLAQQSKLFIEAGGSYQQFKDKRSEDFYNLSKTSVIDGNFGYQLSSHSAIGLRYAHETFNQKQDNRYVFHEFRSERSFKNNTKTNNFGIFYRYYFREKETSKWNVFAEISPSFRKSKENIEELSSTYYNNAYDQPQNIVNIHIDRAFKTLDGSVSIGSSYQLNHNWALQLSLRSIMQIQHEFGDQKTTQYRFFEQILSNNFFSVQYQF
ncbi:outer membrane beta-barrel protein [Sphingobacterium faecium]|uniref:outer membrane beta-barrel protein n=1 Tax=Sphingobacterium faecium TaxID=34087 RepID=UPI003209B22B